MAEHVAARWTWHRSRSESPATVHESFLACLAVPHLNAGDEGCAAIAGETYDLGMFHVHRYELLQKGGVC